MPGSRGSESRIARFVNSFRREGNVRGTSFFRFRISLVVGLLAALAALPRRIRPQPPLGALCGCRFQNYPATRTSSLTNEFRCSAVRPRYPLPMKQERLPDIVSAVALLVLAAVWLWILFAYADWIFGR